MDEAEGRGIAVMAEVEPEAAFGLRAPRFDTERPRARRRLGPISTACTSFTVSVECAAVARASSFLGPEPSAGAPQLTTMRRGRR